MGTNNEWSLVKLDDIVNIISSKRIFAKDYVEQGIPFYRSKEIIEKSSGNEISNKLFITVEKFEEIASKYGYPKEGDILLTSVGTLGVPYLVKDEQFYFKDGNLTWFKDFSKLNNKFLFYWFYSPEAKSQIQSHQIGSTQKALTISNLKSFNINLPTETIQSKIVSILSSLDRKIEVNNKIIDNLEQQAQTIFKSWFIDFEPFQDSEFVDSELGPIPKGWEVTNLGSVAECLLGGTPSRKNNDYWNGDIAWINSGEINKDRIIEPTEFITELGLKKSATKLLPKKTTVLAITGATLGQVSLLEIETCANQSVIGVLENENLQYEYIYLFIKSNIDKIISGQTGGAQQHINSNDVKQIDLILPSNGVLNDYYKLVSPMLTEVANLHFQNKKLAETRDLLLPKLMSGEIDVSDLDL